MKINEIGSGGCRDLLGRHTALKQCTKYWNDLLSFHFQITHLKKKKALIASKSKVTNHTLKPLFLYFPFHVYTLRILFGKLNYVALMLTLYFFLMFVIAYSFIRSINTL